MERRPSPSHTLSTTSADGSENQASERGSSTPWADRDPSTRFVPDPNEVLSWPDDGEDQPEDRDADQGCALFQVSSATESLLKDAFTRTVPNGTRRHWREHYGMPASRFTKCPKLDTTLKSKLPKTCKDADRPLAKTQALLLDALAHLLEQELSKDVVEALTQSLRFLGNASATISNERRCRAGSHFNEDLKCLIEEEDQFRDAAPLLFGNGFLSSAKDHAESVKALDKLSNKNRTLDTSLFGQAAPSTKLLGGAAATVLAATPTSAAEEEDSAPIRGRTTEQTAEGTRSSSNRTKFSRDYTNRCLYARDCVRISQFTPGSLYALHKTSLLPYSVSRNAILAKQTGSLPLAGCIKHFLANWEAITQDDWVTQTITGYKIEFLWEPQQNHRPPPITFTKKEEACMQTEIQSMLDKQAIVETESRAHGFYSQMFLVPKKDGKQRPVINLKRLNQSVKTEHFKMEGIHMLKDLLRAGEWMAKIDLKDAYFMIPMGQEDRDFLKFQWKEKTYQFTCLPFGLSSAPWVFTKTTRPVVATLRELGLRLVIYIDDILIMAETESLMKDHIVAVIYLLGFVINHPKSVLTPTQEIEFLGFTVNSTKMELKLPGEKIKKIWAETGKVLQSPTVSALALSRIIGKMNAATQAISMAPLYYRGLQACLREALQGNQNYASVVTLTNEAREELKWWRDHFTQWNGRSLITHNTSLTIETDASKRGWGAVCNRIRTGGPWNPQERLMHINCLELLAAQIAIKCFAKNKSNLTIHLKMDSVSALRYINKLGGTISPELNHLAKGLWLWCMERNILLKAHLPGVLNTIADNESRVMKDRSDWMLCPRVFQQINQRLGPLEVDLFASRLTYQLPQYASWRPDPLAITFTMNWGDFKGYANPPWSLIGRVLAQTRQQQAELVLVAPVWKAQAWYPVLLNMLTHTPLLIPQRGDLIQATHPESLPEITPTLAVWGISGNVTKNARFLRELRNSSWHRGGKNPPRHMTHSLGNGSAGVVDATVIPFHVL